MGVLKTHMTFLLCLLAVLAFLVFGWPVLMVGAMTIKALASVHIWWWVGAAVVALIAYRLLRGQRICSDCGEAHLSHF